MKLHLADWWYDRIDAMLVTRIEGDYGLERLQLTEPGTVFQLCTDRLIRTIGPSEKLFFNLWFKPMGRREPHLASSWYIRRGVKYWPWWALWKLSSGWETVALRFFHLAYDWGFLDPGDGYTWSLGDWRWRWWRTQRVK